MKKGADKFVDGCARLVMYVIFGVSVIAIVVIAYYLSTH